MIVEQYTDADFTRIKQLHSDSGFDYALPSLSSAEFMSRRVIRADNTIQVAGFLRLQAEAFLISNSGWRTPAWRNEAIKQVSAVCEQDAARVGVQELLAFIPPTIEGKFSKRLKQMGWDSCRKDWTCWYKGVR
jgi:hypothetical protein